MTYVEVSADWARSRLMRYLNGLRDGTHGTFERVSSGAPLLSAKNVQGQGVFMGDDESQISESDSAEIVAHGFPRRGDVLLTIVGTVGRSTVYRLDAPVAFQRSVAFLRPDGRMSSRFLDYQLASSYVQDQMRLATKTSAQPGLYLGEVAALTVLVPPLDEQRAIADYLDRETAQIDALIGKQERLVETLRERRAAVVERAVIDLEWTTPLRSVVRLIQTGPFGSQLKSDEYLEGGVPVINPSHMVDGKVTPDPGVAVSDEKAAELSRHQLREGDLVAARRGELGRCAVVRTDTVRALCGTGSALIRPTATRIDSDFLALIFRSRATRDALSLASVGSTMENLNATIIAALKVPLPPIAEQRVLLTRLHKQTAKIDALIAKVERFIEVSKERRSAFITAAVTGQIDVLPLMSQHVGAAGAQSLATASTGPAEREVQPA